MKRPASAARNNEKGVRCMTPVTIAVAGKGGTGKTTTCGFIVGHLVRAGRKPVLAVDADPNANLNEVLGVDVELTIGDIRETIARADKTDPSPIPAGMTKREYTEFMFNDALIEQADFDMLVMGRTQGRGCYCFVNDLLRAQIEKYADNYRYIVVDNEAGLEHISRGTLPAIDVLLLISDCSRRGIQAAGRIQTMAEALNLRPKAMKLIVNRAPGGNLEPGILEEIAAQRLDLLGVLPQDETVYQYDCAGKPTATVPPDAPVKRAFAGLITKLEL